jgi:hypothetical protein
MKQDPRHSDQAPRLHVPQELNTVQCRNEKAMLRLIEYVGCAVSSTLSHITLYQLYTTNTFQAVVLPLLAHLSLPTPLLVRQI